MFGRLFSRTWDLVGKSLKVRSFRHGVLSSNIANVDTPGFRRKEVPFKEIMQSYLGQDLPLKRTDPRHFPQSPLSQRDWIREPSNDVGTPNNVSLEEEMSKLVENHLLYQATLEALIKELNFLKEALTEGGGK